MRLPSPRPLRAAAPLALLLLGGVSWSAPAGAAPAPAGSAASSTESLGTLAKFPDDARRIRTHARVVARARAIREEVRPDRVLARLADRLPRTLSLEELAWNGGAGTPLTVMKLIVAGPEQAVTDFAATLPEAYSCRTPKVQPLDGPEKPARFLITCGEPMLPLVLSFPQTNSPPGGGSPPVTEVVQRLSSQRAALEAAHRDLLASEPGLELVVPSAESLAPLVAQLEDAARKAHFDARFEVGGWTGALLVDNAPILVKGSGSWRSVLLFLSAIKELPRVVVPIQVRLGKPVAKNGRVVEEAVVELAPLRFRSDLPDAPYDAFTWDPPAAPADFVPSAYTYNPVSQRDPFESGALRDALAPKPPAAIAQQCGEKDLAPAGDALKELELDAVSVAFTCAAGEERMAVFVAGPHRCLVAGLGAPVGRGGGKVQNVGRDEVSLAEVLVGGDGRQYPVYVWKKAADAAPAWFCPAARKADAKAH